MSDASNFKGGLGNGEFKDNTHSSWEKFGSTMKSDVYRNTINGTMFPKRREYADNDKWGKASTKATQRKDARAKTLERF